MQPDSTLCQRVCVPTVDGEDVLDLLLDDLECHLDPVGLGHGVNVIGVELVEVQDLRRRRRGRRRRRKREVEE